MMLAPTGGRGELRERADVPLPQSQGWWGGGGWRGLWWCAWVGETVNDREREFKRHGVCWLAVRTEGEWEVCDSGAWQVQQNKPAVTHGLLHSRLWSDRAGQPTIWDGTAYSSNRPVLHTWLQEERSVCVSVYVCLWGCVLKSQSLVINKRARTTRLIQVK